MKHYKIKKSKVKKSVFVPEGVRVSLKKPKFPKKIFWDVHEVKN